MIVPTVKKLVVYMKGDEYKRVLCDIEVGDDKFSSSRLEQAILARCPFECDEKCHEEIYHNEDNTYEIVHYNDREPLYGIDAVVHDVLEFNGKIFKLQEVQYDMKEFDY